MSKKEYSEDKLIQEPTAEFLGKELGWQTVLAQNEGGFGPDSLLGRNSDARDLIDGKVRGRLVVSIA